MTYIDRHGESYEGSEANVEWWTWSDNLWAALEEKFNGSNWTSLSMIHGEQAAWRSDGQKRCVQCGDPGHAKYDSVLFPAAKHYWMCQHCDDRQKAKYADEAA